MTETLRALVDALTKLRNEASAMMALAYDEMKQAAGYTNVKCLQLRIDEATAVLATAQAASPRAKCVSCADPAVCREPLCVREGYTAQAASPVLSEAQAAGLVGYVNWHGGAHVDGCPEDDTCDCACKPLNDAVNSILAEDFDRRVATQAAPPDPGWRDIASAPKDGTEVLLRGRNWTRTGYWAARAGRWSVDAVVLLDDPILWLPLPAPPVAGPAEE